MTDLEDATAEDYARELCERHSGDEGIYINELRKLAEELADTIDTESAESLLNVAHMHAEGTQ